MAYFVAQKKKIAREVAGKLITGHTTLTVYWTLKHAGVFDAINKEKDGLDPIKFAQLSNMSEDVLLALLTYLAQQELVVFKNDRVQVTPTCNALLEYGDGILEHLRAYDGVTHVLEHLLARLKVYGSGLHRKTDVLWAAQNDRYAQDVYPAIMDAAIKQGATHVLDLGCGTGKLLVLLAEAVAKIVGVGVCDDGVLVRQANAAITAARLEKRLIAVNANAVEICTNTQRTLDRMGVSKQLLEKFDCLIACGVFTDIATKDPAMLADALKQIPSNFKSPTLLLAEPCAGPRYTKNYYAPEMTLLNRLSRTDPLPQEQWRQILQKANLKIAREVALETDGVTLFVCKA